MPGRHSTVEWTYTREGDLEVEETQKYGTATDRDVTYRYDLAGRLESLEYPSGLTLSYTYDDIGRAYVVNDGTYDRVEDTWKGGLLEKREYRNRGGLNRRLHSGRRRGRIRGILGDRALQAHR